MRLFLTVVVGFLASVLAGTMLGVVVADRVRGDEVYILVFMAVPVVALVALAAFVVAWTRPAQRRAVDRVGRYLALLLAATGAILAAMEFFSAPTDGVGRRGLELVAAMTGCSLVTVIVQWLFFRANAREPGGLAHG